MRQPQVAPLEAEDGAGRRGAGSAVNGEVRACQTVALGVKQPRSARKPRASRPEVALERQSCGRAGVAGPEPCRRRAGHSPPPSLPSACLPEHVATPSAQLSLPTQEGKHSKLGEAAAGQIPA